MNLWFRIVWVVLLAWFRPRLLPPTDVSCVSFRAWPLDLDINGHINNGRYLTLMDLGRMDYTLRTGLIRAVIKRGWSPILSAATVRFRREIRLFQAFTIETRLITWRTSDVIIEHRFILKKSGATAAICLQRAGFYDRKAKAFVPVADMMAEIGVVAEAPEMRPDVRAFIELDDTLKVHF